MSEKEIASEIPPNTVNLPEYGAIPIEPNLPVYPTLLDYQAVLDVFSSWSSQVGSIAEVDKPTSSDVFLFWSSQVGSVVEVAEPMSSDWAGLADIELFFEYSSFDLDVVLNFDTDDLQIPQPFLNN